MTKKTERPFGEFHAVCSTDNLRPVLNYAIIKDGSIWATDSFAIIKSDLDLWNAIEPSSIPKAHGKVLHRDKLKKLSGAKVKKIEFEDDGVALYYSWSSAQADEFIRYDAKFIGMDTNRPELCVWLDIKGEMKKNPDYDKNRHEPIEEFSTFMFPNFSSVIPRDFLEGNRERMFPITDSLSLSPLIMNDVFGCFTGNGKNIASCTGVKMLKFSDENTRPIMVIPFHQVLGEDGFLKQFGLVMPVVSVS